MKFKPLLILTISLLCSVFIMNKLNAAWYDWFTGQNKQQQIASVTDKQQNILKLMEVMDIERQIQYQIDMVLNVMQAPLNQLMQVIKKDVPEGEQASQIIFGNYADFKQKLIKSIDYRQIYYDIYDKEFSNDEISELITMFSSDTGKKFIQNNMRLNTAVLVQIQPKVLDALVQELPKVNQKIMTDFIDSDYMDKIIDRFKSEFKNELRELIKE